MNMKHLHRKRIIAWLLFGILLILSGCAKGTETSPQDFANTSNSNGTESEAGTDGESGNSMGRYLEQQIELPVSLYSLFPTRLGNNFLIATLCLSHKHPLFFVYFV